MPNPNPYKIKKGDTLAPIEFFLEDADGRYDLTGCTVAFSMRTKGGAVKVNAQAATVFDQTVAANKGKVSYQPVSADVDTAGTFEAEWIVTKSAKTLTFPNDGHITVEITGDIT